MKKKIGMILFLTIIVIVLKVNKDKNFNEIRDKGNYEIVKEFSKKTDRTSQAVKNKIIIKEGEKFGIIDIKGNKIKETIYDYILRLDKDIYFLQQDKEKVLYNVYLGKEIKVDEVSILDENMYKVMYNNKYGIVDKNLDTIFEIENNFIDGNNENILIFNDNTISLYDKSFNRIDIQEKYEKIKLGVGGYLYAQKNGLWGIINKEGKQQTEFKYLNFLDLNDEDMVIGYTKDKNFLINLKNQKPLEVEVNYENYGVESAERIMVLKNEKIGYIDVLGNEIIEPIYDGGFMFKKDKDFVQVKKNGVWELIDLNGKKYKEVQVDDIGEYQEGYMLVEKYGKYGYMDKKGDIKIPIEYDYAENFSNGLAIVAGDYGYGIIDKNNNIILPLEYDEIEINEDYVYVVKDNKYGLFSVNGEKILDLEFDYLNKIDNDVVFFRKNDKSGFLKLN